MESMSLNQIGNPLELVIAGRRIGMRQEEKIVDPLELLSIHLRGGGQLKHLIQADRRLLTFVSAFADQPRPHRVVKFGERVCHV